MGNDRRINKRYFVTGLKNQVLEPRFFGLFSKPATQEYPCLDISETGLQFISKKTFKLHSRVVLNITTSTTRNQPIRVKAKVVWLRKSFDLSFYLVGTKFVSLSKQNRKELKVLLERVGKYKEEVSQQTQEQMIKKASVHLNLTGKF